jgi:hypothetical protein
METSFMLKPVFINITYPQIKQAAMDYAESYATPRGRKRRA